MLIYDKVIRQQINEVFLTKNVSKSSRAVSTIAWYQVSTGVEVSGSPLATITTEKQTLGNLPLVVSMTSDIDQVNLTDSSGNSHGLNGETPVAFTPAHPYATITVTLASASDQTNELKAAAGSYSFTITGQSWTNKVADAAAKSAFDTEHAGDATAIAAVSVKNPESPDATSRVFMVAGSSMNYGAVTHALTFNFYVRPNGNLSTTDGGDGVDDTTGIEFTFVARVDGGTTTFVDYVDVTTSFVVS